MARRTKPGRNDPCPCGSGEKYKHCCLDREATPGSHFMTRWLILAKADKPADFPPGSDIWTVLTAQLPFCVPGLSGEAFDVTVDECPATVRLTEQSHSVAYVKEALGFEPKGTQLWLAEDPYGRTLFSQAEVLLPRQLMLAGSIGWEQIAAQFAGDEAFPELQKLEARELATALRAVNAVIERHAITTATYWTRHIRPRDVCRYRYAYRESRNGADVQETIVELGGGHELHTATVRPRLPPATVRSLRRSLADSQVLPVERRLLLAAKRMLAEGDPRLAVLELAIALEAGVDSYLRAFCLGRGVRQDDFERMTAEIGLRLIMDTLLPLACPAQLPPAQVQECHGLLTVRNKIMHEARMEVPEAGAARFAAAVEGLLQFLAENQALVPATGRGTG